MKIYVLPPGAPRRYAVQCKDARLTLPKQTDKLRPRELEFTIDRSVPVPQFSEVLVTERDFPLFRGFVQTYTINSKREKTLSCLGMEALLNQRYALPWYYPKSTSFIRLFSDTITKDQVPGLLVSANSALMPGVKWEYETESKNIIKIPGAGQRSRLGTSDIYKAALRGISILTSQASLSYLSAFDNSYYRDTDDLYVRIDNQYERSWADYGGLLFENGFDTTVRLGPISNPTVALIGDLTVSGDAPIGDTIMEIIQAQKYHAHIYDTENRTYISFDKVEGRDTGYVIYENDVETIEKSIPDDPATHAIFGRGAARQFYTACDLRKMGTWTQDTIEVQNGYKDENGKLAPYIEDAFALPDWQYKVSMEQPTGRELILVPGDFVTLIPNFEGKIYASITEIEYLLDETITITLGKRTPYFDNTWDILQSPSTGYNIDYMQSNGSDHTCTCYIYPSDPAHSWTASTDEQLGQLLYYSIPSGAIADALFPKVILSIDIKQESMSIWALDTHYVIGSWVSHITGRYKCLADHTPVYQTQSIYEPGVGSQWTSYWAEYSSANLELGQAAIVVTIDGNPLRYGNFLGINLNASPTIEVDITDDVIETKKQKIYVAITLAEDYGPTHTTATDHPKINLSGKISFYKRKAVQ